MVKIQLVARIILGLIYFMFGLMGLAMIAGFMHPPEPAMPEAATAFMKGMTATGYFIPVLKVTESVCGFLLLCGLAVPLALIILAPVTLHIALFHYLLTPGMGNFVLPTVMVITHVIAMSAYWKLYQRLFSK